MKHVICEKYGTAEVLKFEKAKIPLPNEDEIQIRIHYCSVSQADVRVRAFKVPPIFWLPAKFMLGFNKPKKNVLGAEISGIITSVGSHVTRFKIGDKIMVNLLPSFGGYSEYICIHEDSNISIAPNNLKLLEAAALPIGAITALHYLRKLNPAHSSKILIYGASGSVGTYAVQIAKHLGLEVTTVCSSKNFDTMKSLGADSMIDYKHPDFYKQIGTYDTIFIAHDQLPFSIASKHLNKNGTYINIVRLTKSFKMLIAQWKRGIKIYLSQDPKDEKKLLQQVRELVELNVLAPVIDNVFTFSEIKMAHKYVDKGHKKGNVCLEIQETKA